MQKKGIASLTILLIVLAGGIGYNFLYKKNIDTHKQISLSKNLETLQIIKKNRLHKQLKTIIYNSNFLNKRYRVDNINYSIIDKNRLEQQLYTIEAVQFKNGLRDKQNIINFSYFTNSNPNYISSDTITFKNNKIFSTLDSNILITLKDSLKNSIEILSKNRVNFYINRDSTLCYICSNKLLIKKGLLEKKEQFNTNTLYPALKIAETELKIIEILKQ